MSKSVFLGTAAVVAMALALPVRAADSVETIVVSATRSEQPLDVTGTTVSVLDGDALQARQSVQLVDALATLPSVSVNRTGGVGQVSTVSIRGAEAGQTVTLIDGVRLNDPSDVSGGVPFGDLFLNNIARIEVLEGAQSALYGSDAIGGVINILTKRGGQNPVNVTLSAEYGSYNTDRINLAANGTAGAVEYGGAVNDFSTKGISAAARKNGNPEADGTRNLSATLNTRTHLGAGVSIDLAGFYSHAHTQFDDNYAWTPPYALSDSAAYSINAVYAGHAGVNVDLFDGRLKNRVSLIASASDRDFYDSGSDSVHHNYAYDGSAVRFEYQGVFDLDAHTQATFGAETERTAFVNNSYYSYMSSDHLDGHKRISSGYAQIQRTLFDHLTLTAGGRIDDDSQFGTHTSAKLAAAWTLEGGRTTVHANYADGFKAPTLYQLFSAYSNPIADLKPEQAKSWEVGVTRKFFGDAVVGSVTYFERRTADMIDFQTCYSASDAPGCPSRLAQYGYYINLGRTMAKGVEVGVNATLSDALSLTARYTTMDAYNRASGLDLSRRPHVSAYGALNWAVLADLHVGADIRYTGKRFNDTANSVSLGANETAGLFADYDVDAHWQVFARIDNLLNDRTARIYGYGTPGLSASFGLRVRQ